MKEEHSWMPQHQGVLVSQQILPTRTSQDELQSLDFRSEPAPDGLSCIARAVMACGRQYDGESFGYCLVGVLLGNALLPSSVSATLSSTPLDISGAFQTGMRLDCKGTLMNDVYPSMLES